jgi:hypothetical protein
MATMWMKHVAAGSISDPGQERVDGPGRTRLEDQVACNLNIATVAGRLGALCAPDKGTYHQRGRSTDVVE